MNDIITNARAAIDRVIEGGASEEDVLVCIDVVARLKELTRELADKSETAIVAWLGQNGDIERGQVRYYAAATKTNKVRDNDAMLKAVLTATGGDVDAIGKCLASGAWKVSAVRELLPADEYEGLVEVVEAMDFKTGKPKVKVQKFDKTFVKGKASAAGTDRRANDAASSGDLE